MELEEQLDHLAGRDLLVSTDRMAVLVLQDLREQEDRRENQDKVVQQEYRYEMRKEKSCLYCTGTPKFQILASHD